MKILVDLPDELYDTIRNKTLNLTSGARSNGKHLVYELIGCVLNGTVVEEKQTGRELFESICEKYGVKKDNEGNGLRIITEDGQVKPLTKELLHEIFPFDVPFVTGLSADSADVPECETWSNNEEPIEIKYGEKNLVDFTKSEYVESQEHDDNVDCRDCRKFEDCLCGKDGHESGTSQGYSIGECKEFELQERNGER